MRALRYEDPLTDRRGHFVDLGAGVRVRAAEALGAADHPDAHQALLQALADPEEVVRVAAVRALGEDHPPEAAAPLAVAVTEWAQPEFAQARMAALAVLTSLSDQPHLERVAAALLVRSERLDDVDAHVVRSLAEVARERDIETTVADLMHALAAGEFAERARAILAWLAPHSISALVDGLLNEDVQSDAALALGEAGDARAVELLCEVMASATGEHARASAAAALGNIRHPAAARALLEATADPALSVRVAALEAFDRLGNVGVVIATQALALSPGSVGDGHGGTALPSGDSRRSSVRPTAAKVLSSPRPTPVLRRLLGWREGA